MNRRQLTLSEYWSRSSRQRRGVIIVLTSFLLTVLFAFLALSVDTGRVVLTETEMQNAVDAAALAASQEITAAVYAAGQGQGSANIDANSIVVQAARQMAGKVAEANGVFIDPAQDVQFGKRAYDHATGGWPVQWGVAPFNVVKVTARRTNEDTTADDGQLKLAFGWAIGKDSVPIQTSATAFVEARDLVLVLDFSGSMNYDSQLTSSLGMDEAEGILDDMWDTLVAADPKFPGTSTSKFPSTGFGNINSYYGTYVSSTTTSTIMSTLGLTQNDAGGNRKFPYPQAGRSTNGLPKSKPSNSTSDTLWQKYIEFVKNHPVSAYKKRYGYRTLMDYLQQKAISGFTPRDRYTSEDMWRTQHQPMTAVKSGTSLFLQFLTDLDFGDEVGLVGYGEWAEWIDNLNDGEINVDIAADPITPDYDKVDQLQLHHQAGEFNGQTSIGDGILKGRQLLVGTGGTDTGHSRYGARPTILLMTDGQANQKPANWSMPQNFSWAAWTDFDKDGDADYTTSDAYKRYAFYEATEAIKRGVTIHTLAVGNEADVPLMQAIAHAGGGTCIVVPGGTSVPEMTAELLEAFGQIAAKVPPAQLVYEE